MDFADTSAAEIYARCSLPQIEYSIPIINEFAKNGPFHQPRLFIILGHAQSYKTSIAVELLTSFTTFEHLNCEALWLDCNYKFPIDLLRMRNINLEKLKVAQCRSSEDLIFDLLSIEHEIQMEEAKGAPLRAIVVDAINTSFWIDKAENKFSSFIWYNLKDIVERLVNCHGITMIVVMDDLGFDPWTKFENTPIIKLVCSSKTPGKGQLIYESISANFIVLEDRSFCWKKNINTSNNSEKEENESNNESEDSIVSDNY